MKTHCYACGVEPRTIGAYCGGCKKAYDRAREIRNQAVIPTEKPCLRCAQILPPNAFDRAKCNKTGRAGECRRCRSLTSAAKTHGMTRDALLALWDAQGRACAVCRRDLPVFPSVQAHVDHDHATGRVRGVLCQTCNRGLGLFHDDIGKLGAAIEYLRALC